MATGEGKQTIDERTLQDQLLTTQEAADYLGKSLSTIKYYRTQGLFPDPLFPGRPDRYTKQQIDDFAREKDFSSRASLDERYERKTISPPEFIRDGYATKVARGEVKVSYNGVEVHGVQRDPMKSRQYYLLNQDGERFHTAWNNNRLLIEED